MGSTAAWLIAATRRSAGLPIIPAVAVGPATWPLTAVVTALGWVLLQAVGRVVSDLRVPPPTPDVRNVSASLILAVVIWLVLLAALFVGNSTPRERLGFSGSRWPEQLGWGMLAYLAAIGPTLLVLAATFPWRSPKTQHEFLRLLSDSPDLSTVTLMLLTVAVVAPLSEELLFRVVLQGWLSEHFGARWAIPGVALIFAFVHGWRDGLALVPLALILGYVFDRRRSYLAVVTTHALFNSVMFGLQWLSALQDRGS